MRAAKSGLGSFCLGLFLLMQTLAAVRGFQAWFRMARAKGGIIRSISA